MKNLSYIKVTLLKDFVLGPGVDYGTAGAIKYWKILEKDKYGYLIKLKADRAFLFKEDVEAGEKHTEPNFSYPLGLHFGLELVEAPPRLSQRLLRTAGRRWPFKNAKNNGGLNV